MMKNKQEFGSLLLRVILGFTFFMHGFVKFQEGIEDFANNMHNMGLPSFLGYIVASIEVVGGIALILGLGTKIFSILIALIMIGAIIFVKLNAGFLDGYELDVILLGIAIHLGINGSLLLSVDAKLSKLKNVFSRTNNQESISNQR